MENKRNRETMVLKQPEPQIRRNPPKYQLRHRLSRGYARSQPDASCSVLMISFFAAGMYIVNEMPSPSAHCGQVDG